MATISCPNCGLESSGEERCPGCSLPLTVSCPDCGAHNSSEDEVCVACGSSLAHATSDGV